MAGLPQPGGAQRDQSKFIVFENFEKMNTQSIRQSLSEKELAWLENLQPISGNNLTTVPAPAAAALATIGESISTMFYAALNEVDYFVAFSTAGSGYLINIATGVVNHFAPDGSFSAQPDVTTWEASRLLIADSVAGYSTFDGTIYVSQGGVSPNITVTAGGTGYGAPPPVTISGGSGTGATAVATVQNGAVIEVTLTNPGRGYLPTDTLTVSFGVSPGSGAAGHVTMTGFPVVNVTVGNPGAWINAAGSPNPQPNNSYVVNGAGGGGTGAVALISVGFLGEGSQVSAVTLLSAGSGYTSAPTFSLSFPAPQYVKTYPIINTYLGTESVASIVRDAGGSGYTAPPDVMIVPPDGIGSGATAVATESGGVVTGLTLTNGGGGYDTTPNVIIGTGTGAAASAHVWPFINSSIAAYAFTTVAVFQGRVWLGGGPVLTWTGTGASYGNVAYDDFLDADASGSLIISDADLIHAITALRSLNNYLFIMGDQSVKQIGNISLNSAGNVTLFTILTLSSDQGTIYPKSCISYNRVFLFANTNGIYGVFGSSVQKLSGDMDGIFKLIDFTQVPQGALADINAIHNAVFLVRYKDPLLGTRSIMLVFDGKKWFVLSQGGGLTAIATSASFATGQLSLYGSSGPDVTNLLAAPAIPVPFKIQSALTHHGNAVQGKKVIRVGFSSEITANGAVVMTIDTEAGLGAVHPMKIDSGFSLVGGANDADNEPIGASGIYVGMTITGTLASFTMTNMILEQQDTSLWKGA